MMFFFEIAPIPLRLSLLSSEIFSRFSKTSLPTQSPRMSSGSSDPSHKTSLHVRLQPATVAANTTRRRERRTASATNQHRRDAQA